MIGRLARGRSAVVAENACPDDLRVIDATIEELRHALAAEPGNQRLETLLLAQHRSEIDLLQRLRRATETS